MIGTESLANLTPPWYFEEEKLGLKHLLLG